MKYRLKQIHGRPRVAKSDPVVVYCAYGKALGGEMELQP